MYFCNKTKYNQIVCVMGYSVQWLLSEIEMKHSKTQVLYNSGAVKNCWKKTKQKKSS